MTPAPKTSTLGLGAIVVDELGGYVQSGEDGLDAIAEAELAELGSLAVARRWR
jgi:hypothetical protein